MTATTNWARQNSLAYSDIVPRNGSMEPASTWASSNNEESSKLGREIINVAWQQLEWKPVSS